MGRQQMTEMLKGTLEGIVLAMEYIDGEDLGSLLRRIGSLPGDKASEIARKICAGLAAAHNKGVLHRDLNLITSGTQRQRLPIHG